MSSLENLHPLSKNDLENASTVLASAFSNDPIIKAMNLEVEEIKLMYEIPIRSCLRYGEVLASSENLEGIMAFCPGKYANMRLWNIIRSGALIPSLKLLKRLKPMQKITKVLEEDKKNSISDLTFIYSCLECHENLKEKVLVENCSER